VGEQNVMIRAPGALSVRADELIHIEWMPSDTHWFDAASERRIERA
jgi:hypothetical protein